MPLTRTFMLERSRDRDAEFDGRFLTGVLSTGIYCLPSCPARNPKAENVRFFGSEPDARRAGLRPCKRCRPDHFYKGYDPGREAVRALARDVTRAPAEFPDARAMAASSGIGATKLTALFKGAYHQTPAAFLVRRRVEAARQRLLETDERVLAVGLGVGFESSSAFHDNFKRQTGLAPRDYRKLRAEITFRLSLPAGFRAADFMRYQGRDPDSVTERVSGRAITRALAVGRSAVLLTMEMRTGEARCTVTAPRGRLATHAVRDAHAAAVRLLALESDPAPFERRVSTRLGLGRLVRGNRGLRIPLTADPFEAAAWSIVGQQVNLGFAFTMRRRFGRLCGRPAGGGLFAPPTPAAVAQLDYADLRALQFTNRKAEYLIDLARRIDAREVSLSASAYDIGAPDEPAASIVERLTAVRGLGPWSVQYILMRGFGFADCVPVGDSGLGTALATFFDLPERPGRAETMALMAPFAPHRSLATFHLWNKLGDPA